MIALALVSLLATSEVDPYYGWLHPPRDSTGDMNRIINEHIADGLRDVNKKKNRADMSCRDVASGAMSRLYFTAFWYPLGEARTWNVDISPRSRTEMSDQYRRESVYRYAPFFTMGSLLPMDPTVSVGGVYFGTDKIGHFFTQGMKYYDHFLAARSRGLDADRAEREAIDLGLEREDGFLGTVTNGVLSYGDLESNYQGLTMYRTLCEDEKVGLRFDKKKKEWVLGAPFALERWVTPCWDEGYYTSGFKPKVGESVCRALEEMCGELARPEIVRIRASYEERGCHNPQVKILEEKIERGELVDPRTCSVDTVCGPLHDSAE